MKKFANTPQKYLGNILLVDKITNRCIGDGRNDHSNYSILMYVGTVSYESIRTLCYKKILPICKSFFSESSCVCTA